MSPLQSVEIEVKTKSSVKKGFSVMPKEGIHPNYNEIRVKCACGSNFVTRSTHKGDLHVEICSACHPFFTGKQKLGRHCRTCFSERFRRKYAASDAACRDTSQATPLMRTRKPASAGLFLRKGFNAQVRLQAEARQPIDGDPIMRQSVAARLERKLAGTEVHWLAGHASLETEEGKVYCFITRDGNLALKLPAAHRIRYSGKRRGRPVSHGKAHRCASGSQCPSPSRLQH